MAVTPKKTFVAGDGPIRAELVGVTAFRKSLAKLAPEVKKAFDKRLRGIAAKVAADAKRRASWSSRIPGTIRPSVTRRGVGVRMTGKGKAPHGRGYELGSSGNAGMVRHPLFGNREFWFSTPVRPFLFPAVDANRKEAVNEALDAVKDAARRVGWR